MYNSSCTTTSSPKTVVPSILTQRPTIERQPIIELSIHAWDFIIAPFRIVVRFIQTPETFESIKTLKFICKLD